MGRAAKWLGWMMLGLVGAAAHEAQASVVQAMDLEALALAAEQVVVARVVAEESHYDEHGRIVTDVEFIVEQSEKGGARPGSTLLVRRLGGVVDGVGMRVEGEPTFEAGERTLLFAQTFARAAVLRAVGMSQGVLRITERDGESWVTSRAAGAALVRRAANGSLVTARAAIGGPRKLNDVLSEVRSVLAKAQR